MVIELREISINNFFDYVGGVYLNIFIGGVVIF